MQTLQYPDLSHYQAGISLSGLPAVIAKATEGSSYTDPEYARIARDARAMGIPFAGYHWLHVGNASGQAAKYHSVAGTTPCMIDVEHSNDNPSVQDCLNFKSSLNALGVRVPLVYVPKWYWQQYMGSEDLRPLVAAGMKIVSSNYPNAGYSDNGPGWAPYGGITPTVWQYTDAHQINGYSVDMNAYKGTVEDFRALLNGGSSMALEEIVPQTGNRALGTTESDLWNNEMTGHSGYVPTQMSFRSAQLNRIEAVLKEATPVSISPTDLQSIADEVSAATGAKLDEVVAKLDKIATLLAAAGQALTQ